MAMGISSPESFSPSKENQRRKKAITYSSHVINKSKKLPRTSPNLNPRSHLSSTTDPDFLKGSLSLQGILLREFLSPPIRSFSSSFPPSIIPPYRILQPSFLIRNSSHGAPHRTHPGTRRNGQPNTPQKSTIKKKKGKKEKQPMDLHPLVCAPIKY
ncbi:hypothetical protein TNCT_442291 [Trichonephila clavata]|uniref:Uncharacterized protein n=1 Tax=Trichonephila clavata TaxID=2740835 RepID=A0A8X6LR26_TRICU|nr:hypothetical protein TNCT_442291 [Trichonephila clavata]